MTDGPMAHASAIPSPSHGSILVEDLLDTLAQIFKLQAQ